MTIRTDISIDWDSSPRVLTVASPSDEITIQDLVDTCRDFEDSPVGMCHDDLIDAAGKEFLGGITYVGITATLQNCVVAFEARGGPSWVLCIISGGNIVAVDENGDALDPRQPTAYTSCDRASSSSATAILAAGSTPQDVADAVWAATTIEGDVLYLLKSLKNKKSLVKAGSVWQLIIYDDDDTTPILTKDLKDKDGNDITDLEAGTLAEELASSV